MKHDLFICQCESSEHQVIFSYFDDGELREVYMTTYLCKCNNFWRRLVYGIKYIFGYKSKYGAFDEFIFKGSDADKLQRIVDYMKK